MGYRVVHRKRKVSLVFPDDTPGLIAQGDIAINSGRLRARVVVFTSPTKLNQFWKRWLGSSLGRRGECPAAVNALGFTVYNTVTGQTRYEVDRRYFCIIGLTRGRTSMEVLSHEAVHAAYAFVDRSHRNWWTPLAKENPEEAIAYPVGRIASELARFCRKHHLND